MGLNLGRGGGRSGSGSGGGASVGGGAGVGLGGSWTIDSTICLFNCKESPVIEDPCN